MFHYWECRWQRSTVAMLLEADWLPSLIVCGECWVLARITILCDWSQPPEHWTLPGKLPPCLARPGRSYKLQLTLALRTQTASELARGLRWPSPELGRSSSAKISRGCLPGLDNGLSAAEFSSRENQKTLQSRVHTSAVVIMLNVGLSSPQSHRTGFTTTALQLSLPDHIWVECKQEEVSKDKDLIFFKSHNFRAWLY